jgi:uncharacterized protein
MTPDVAEKLLAWKVMHYQITIDGMREQHDKKRPARDGCGTFDQIIANLIELKKRPEKYRVRVRVNYDKENHPHIEDLLVLWKRSWVETHLYGRFFHGVGIGGGPNVQEPRSVWVEEVKL